MWRRCKSISPTYRDELARRLGRTYGVMQNLRQRAQAAPKRIVFSEGEHDKVLRASHQIIEERIAYPILLGRPAVIETAAEGTGLGGHVSEGGGSGAIPSF